MEVVLHNKMHIIWATTFVRANKIPQFTNWKYWQPKLEVEKGAFLGAFI